MQPLQAVKAQLGVRQLPRHDLGARGGPGALVRRDDVTPETKLDEDVRWHVQRMLGIGRNLCVAAGRRSGLWAASSGLSVA